MSDKQTSSICPELMGEPPRGGNRFSGWLGQFLMRLAGWSFQGELSRYRKMVIGVAPHTSNWDFFLGVAVLFALRIRIRFLGKHTIFVPVVKQLLQSIGGIPVDRRSPHGVVGQVVDEFARKDEMILAIAPEGTRSPIYPWKTGFLAIAESAKVPVVLIGFDFKLKKIIFGPVLSPELVIADKMHMVYEFFATVHAKYPHNVKFPEQ